MPLANARRTHPALLTGALGLAALTGCDAATVGQAAGNAVAAPTAQTLSKAAPSATSPTYRYTLVDAEGTARGAVDPAKESRLLEYDQKVPELGKMTMSLLSVSDTVYARFTFATPVPALAPVTRWSRIDPSRLTDKGFVAEVSGVGDPGNTAILLDSAEQVTGASTDYRGVLNLGKLGDPGMLLKPERVKALGAKASALPFTAVLDERQRLTKLTVTVPAAGAYQAEKQTASYTYDPVALPDVSGAKPGPALLYTLLNGS